MVLRQDTNILPDIKPKVPAKPPDFPPPSIVSEAPTNPLNFLTADTSLRGLTEAANNLSSTIRLGAITDPSYFLQPPRLIGERDLLVQGLCLLREAILNIFYEMVLEYMGYQQDTPLGEGKVQKLDDGEAGREFDEN
ncbi:MAG: hypothetical protein Q9216_006020 [Gyalolechia sp. 2 TL-2023]